MTSLLAPGTHGAAVAHISGVEVLDRFADAAVLLGHGFYFAAWVIGVALLMLVVPLVGLTIYAGCTKEAAKARRALKAADLLRRTMRTCLRPGSTPPSV